jgi:hypothetical protein
MAEALALIYKEGTSQSQDKTIYYNGDWYTESEWNLYAIENELPPCEQVATNCAEHSEGYCY